MKTFAWILSLALFAAPGIAQEKSEAPAKPRTVTALRVQLVLSRYKGEQKLSSRPYMMTLVNNRQTTLRQGTEVPIAVATFDKEQGPATSYQYRNVGSTITCTADPVEAGRYDLQVAVEDSSLGDTRTVGPVNQKAVEAPVFLTRNVSGHALVRDGETVALYSATDATNGEVTKLDVTLTVLK